MTFLSILIMAAIGYFLGSLSTAIIVSRWFGMPDPRSYGSGNPGASNMLRSGRKDAAAITLAGDALKGLIVVLITRCLHMSDGVIAFTAIAVVIGHMYPYFFNFKGGKGVATAFGVILGMSLWTGILSFAIWFVVAKKYKQSSLAALIAAICAPFIFFIINAHHPKWGWALLFISILVWYRHRDNIRRLCAGKELLIGEQAQPLNAPTPAPMQENTQTTVVDHAIESTIEQSETNPSEANITTAQEENITDNETTIETATTETKDHEENHIEQAIDPVQEENNSDTATNTKKRNRKPKKN